MSSDDPTKLKNYQSNVKKERDPLLVRMTGRTNHKNMEFDVPYISQIRGNLWQGGSDPALQLPHFFKHYISVAPWYNYQIKHPLDSSLWVVMMDSEDQGFEQVDALANWVNVCREQGPTLVHCQAGLNRSSLIVARALFLSGEMTGDEAVELLREVRSPAVLCNQSFEDEVRSWK